MRRRLRPPPVLNGGRVLAYVIFEAPRAPAPEGMTFVGNKPLGRVSSLAIIDMPRRSGRQAVEVLLLYCTRAWFVRGVAGFKSVALAKRRGLRMFPGAQWSPSRVTKVAAEQYLKTLWAGEECSFCGRRPDQVERMIAARRARICHGCVSEFSAIMGPSKSERGA